MIDTINTLISTPFEVVRSNGELSIMLMRVYSTLYLAGQSPNFCESCQRKYHEQIKKNGLEQYKIYEAVKNRTCKPKRVGIVYHSLLNDHIDFSLLSDERAIELLKKNILKETDFEILPTGYKVEEVPTIQVSKTKKSK